MNSVYPRALAFAIGLLLCLPLQAQRTLIHAGTLLDGTDAAPRREVTLVIENGKVTAVENGYRKATGTEQVIDLKSKWVLPGFIDCHTHLSSQTQRGESLAPFRKYPADVALESLKYLKTTLLAGFTTVRDLGAGEGIDLALRDAVNRGDVIGPRMFVAGKALAVLGGHADPTNSYREDILGVPGIEEGVTNGIESCRRAALLAIKRGGDVIKITATAGVLSKSKFGSVPQFTEEEIRTIVKTAADFGIKVAAHCHGAEGIKRATRAGVASIEHGSYLDDEAINLMKANGTYLVPTVTAGRSVADSAKIPGYYLPFVAQKATTIGALIQENFTKAYKAGVKIAFGTDAGVFRHGENSWEFVYMQQSGMPPAEIIRCATQHAATLLGKEEQIGTLQPGRYADVVAVDADPLKDIGVLRRIPFVMKEGVVYKQ